MMRRWMTLAALVLLLGVHGGSREAHAGLFNSGIGSAMYYGPYTGGHGYSYAEAYHYNLSFSAADSWRRDPLAYPAGPYPYRPPYPLFSWYHARYNATGVPGAPEVVPLQVLPLQPVPGGPAGAVSAGAVVQVTVPADAEVWVEGDKTRLTGDRREFVSPPLVAGKNYLYTVRARWMEAGRSVEQIQVVAVQAGNRAEVRFPAGSP
jgi:uncharacterized protein (TIGR03000 family)